MEANHALRRVLVGTAVAAVICSGLALATPGSGTSSTLVGPSATFEPFKIVRGFNDLRKPMLLQETDSGATLETMSSEEREEVDGWPLEIVARQGLNVATQTITFQPGGQSGWHTHPGPVFISVKEGTMTFYDENCIATVRMAGEGFLDTGADPHLARNETGSPATNVVTYFTPPRAPSLRIDAPQPQNCRL